MRGRHVPYRLDPRRVAAFAREPKPTARLASVILFSEPFSRPPIFRPRAILSALNDLSVIEALFSRDWYTLGKTEAGLLNLGPQ